MTQYLVPLVGVVQRLIAKSEVLEDEGLELDEVEEDGA